MAKEVEQVVMQTLVKHKWFINKVFAYEHRLQRQAQLQEEGVMIKKSKIGFNKWDANLLLLMRTVFLLCNVGKIKEIGITCLKFIKNHTKKRMSPIMGGSVFLDNNEAHWYPPHVIARFRHLEEIWIDTMLYAGSARKTRKLILIEVKIHKTLKPVRNAIKRGNLYNLRELFGGEETWALRMEERRERRKRQS